MFVVGEKKARIHAHSLLIATEAPGLLALIEKAVLLFLGSVGADLYRQTQKKEASASSQATPVEVAIPNIEPGAFAAILEFM